MADRCQVCETEAKPADLKTWTRESFAAKDKAGKALLIELYLCRKCTEFAKSQGGARTFLEKRLPKDVTVTR